MNMSSCHRTRLHWPTLWQLDRLTALLAERGTCQEVSPARPESRVLPVESVLPYPLALLHWCLLTGYLIGTSDKFISRFIWSIAPASWYVVLVAQPRVEELRSNGPRTSSAYSRDSA